MNNYKHVTAVTLWLFVIDLTLLVSDPVVIMHNTGPLICGIFNPNLSTSLTTQIETYEEK